MHIKYNLIKKILLSVTLILTLISNFLNLPASLSSSKSVNIITTYLFILINVATVEIMTTNSSI